MSTAQKAPDGRRPPERKGRKRPAVRWIMDGLLVVALAAGLFALLPRLGGVQHDAAALRHARLAFVAPAIVAEAASLVCYALLYRRVLASLGARLPVRRAVQITLATFLVSHVTPVGSVAGTALNVSALDAEGIDPATAADAIGVTSLVSSIALLALFGTGFAATAGRHLPHGYLVAVGTAAALVAAVLAVMFLAADHPAIAERAGRRVARLAQRLRPGIDPETVGQSWARLVSLTRSALTGWAFWQSFGLAAADLLCDLLSLDLMFLAFGYQPGFGPLAVAYGAANIASAIPLTPGGLGVIEVALVGTTVAFGAPRATAVLATLGYRLVNYWLPLPAGAVAYLRLKLRPRGDAAAREQHSAEGTTDSSPG